MKMLRFFSVILIACAVGRTAISAPSETLVIPDDFPAARRVIQVINGSNGPPPSGEIRYTLAESELVVERRAGRLVLKAQDRIRLDAASTQAAWDLVDRLKIATWKPSYPADGRVSPMVDGTRWSVSLRINGVETTSNGVNAYPPRPDGKLIGFEHGQPVGDSYHTLLSFLASVARKK